MDTKDNPKKEYAFPSKEGDIKNDDKGLTVRDYFAAKAMQAIYSNTAILKHADKNDPHTDIAKDCYIIADAMLEVRKDSSPD